MRHLILLLILLFISQANSFACDTATRSWSVPTETLSDTVEYSFPTNATSFAFTISQSGPAGGLTVLGSFNSTQLDADITIAVDGVVFFSGNQIRSSGTLFYQLHPSNGSYLSNLGSASSSCWTVIVENINPSPEVDGDLSFSWYMRIDNGIVPFVPSNFHFVWPTLSLLSVPAEFGWRNQTFFYDLPASVRVLDTSATIQFFSNNISLIQPSTALSITCCALSALPLHLPSCITSFYGIITKKSQSVSHNFNFISNVSEFSKLEYHIYSSSDASLISFSLGFKLAISKMTPSPFPPVHKYGQASNTILLIAVFGPAAALLIWLLLYLAIVCCCPRAHCLVGTCLFIHAFVLDVFYPLLRQDTKKETRENLGMCHECFVKVYNIWAEDQPDEEIQPLI